MTLAESFPNVNCTVTKYSTPSAYEKRTNISKSFKCSASVWMESKKRRIGEMTGAQNAPTFPTWFMKTFST